jgi:hypothetical protein
MRRCHLWHRMTAVVIAGLDTASRGIPDLRRIRRRNAGRPELRCNPSPSQKVFTKKMDPRVKPAGDRGLETDEGMRSNQQRFCASRLIIISLPLTPGRTQFGPTVIRVRTAKSAIAGDHLLHAHFPGRQTAIVGKCTAASIRARAPRSLVGLAGGNVEQHCRCHRDHDEYELHGSSPAYTDACRLVSGMSQVSQVIVAQCN